MMTPEKILYETEVTATGGRDGKAASVDGLLSVSLSVPKSLGGPGGEGTNPEQLFAAGYAACFLGAVKLVARTRKVVPSAEPSVTAKVAMGPVPVGYGQSARRREVRGRGGRRRCARALPLFERNPRQYCREADGGLRPMNQAGGR